MSSFDPLGVSAPPVDSVPERDINGNPMPPKASAPAEAAPVRDARPSWERAGPRPPAANPTGVTGFRAVPLPQPAARPSPPATPPPAPSYAASGETVKYDLAGNPLPSSVSAGPSSHGGQTPSYAPTPAQAVRYDLSGNPLPGAAAPQMAPAGAWPPAPVGVLPAGFDANSSGKQEDVPPEIERLKWNWGAFFFPTLWLKNHKMTTLAALAGSMVAVPRMIHNYLPFISFTQYIAIAGLVVYWIIKFYFGHAGHRMGWRNRRFQGGVDEFFKVQRAWAMWGIGLAVLELALMGLVLGPVLAGHSQTASDLEETGSHHSRPLSDSPDTAPSEGEAPDTSAPPASGSGAP